MASEYNPYIKLIFLNILKIRILEKLTFAQVCTHVLTLFKLYLKYPFGQFITHI
jgi:hypothetical protein